MRINKLYIIGNGFDLHHKLDTRYSSFGKFLSKNYNEVYESLIEFYGFEDVARYEGDELWSLFEQHLAEIDVDHVIDSHRDSIANPGSSSFRDRDWGTFSIEIEMLVDRVTKDLFKAFNEFILQIEYPRPGFLLSLEKTAQYLNFNYTNTLQRYYSIPDKNITYIHEKAENLKSELILGHGIDPKHFEEKKQEQPIGLNDEELAAWKEMIADQYSYSFELGKAELFEYFVKSFKNTPSIIKKHKAFFESLIKVDDIIILGHSLSDVDIKYFEEIFSYAPQNTHWTVSYYSVDEKDEHFETLVNLGINAKNISLKLINDII